MAAESPHNRIGAFDAARGLSVASMVLFHFCYDLRFIEGVDLAWFRPPLQDIWRCSISWTFLFVAGCMCALSRSNLKRGLVYAGCALAVWAVTTVVAVDDAINFGIIFCMAACTLAAAGLQKLRLMPRGYAAAACLIAAFLTLQGLQGGTILFGKVGVPDALYSTPLFSWLGFPGPGFSSGDYYPLLPYLFLYLAGVACSFQWKAQGYPEWAREFKIAPLNFLGRHALAVYAIHQPVLLAICGLL